jgi:hypothetical protein
VAKIYKWLAILPLDDEIYCYCVNFKFALFLKLFRNKKKLAGLEARNQLYEYPSFDLFSFYSDGVKMRDATAKMFNLK